MTTPRQDPTAGRDGARGLVIVIVVALAYALLHAGFRLLASPVLGEDDPLELILVQELRLGYDAVPRQPPLYDWLLWGLLQVTGPRLEAFLLIKYAALVATAGFLYAAALRALGDRLWAMLTVESLALIYQIAWRYHEGFTHRVGAMVAVAALLWALLRLIDLGRPRDVLVLGVICGLGLLTELTFGAYLVALLLAAALQPAIRQRLFRPSLLLAGAIAALCVAPWLWWLASEPARLSAFLAGRGGTGNALTGLKDALRGPWLYLSPLILILPVMFPGMLRVAWADVRRHPNAAASPDHEQLVLHGALVAYALSIVGAPLLAIPGFPVHALMPLYVTSVVWLFGAARRGCDAPLRIARFTRLALAIAVFALVARLANMFVLDPVCKLCRWGIPYEGLAAEMRREGFTGGTLVAFDDELAGNLRQRFPDIAIVTRRHPVFTPARADLDQGPVAYVWDARVPDATARSHFADTLRPGLDLASARRLDVPWKHLWRPTGYRVTPWKVLIVRRR